MNRVRGQLECEPQRSGDEHHTGATEAEQWKRNTRQGEHTGHGGDVQNDMRGQPAEHTHDD